MHRDSHRPSMRVATTVLACVLTAAVAGCGADSPLTTASTQPLSTTSDHPTASVTQLPPSTPARTPPDVVTTGPPAASATSWPPFSSSTEPVTTARLGSTWHPGCPVGPEELSLVRLTYATFDGGSATGELVVATAAAADVIGDFSDLYDARFPITRMVTIDAYDADDDASMADDNTSAFNCRAVTGGTGWSRHSYGLAIDINPLRNPYVTDDVVLPPAGTAYLDRSDVRPGMIVAGGVVVRAFASRGFEWGGDFQTLKDYQHFDR